MKAIFYCSLFYGQTKFPINQEKLQFSHNVKLLSNYNIEPHLTKLDSICTYIYPEHINFKYLHKYTKLKYILTTNKLRRTNSFDNYSNI